MGLGIVLGAAVLAWLLLAGPAMLLGGAGPEVTVPALVVCLAPNLLALGAAELAQARGQTVQTAVVLVSFVVRPVVAFGLGLAAYYLLPDLQGRAVALLVWGALFYLILLAAESVVVSRRVAGATAGR
jgi:hypothetical protein